MDTQTSSPLKIVIFALGALAALTPWVSPAAALILGIALSLLVGNPWPKPTATGTRRILAWSVVGLGADMNLGTVLRVGGHGIVLTFCSILFTMGLGIAFAQFLKVRGKAGILVAAGTAICGGSAIAALAPAIQAEEEDTGVALVTVFLLNAVALVLFPLVGHALGMNQHAFGLWSALAIHDTSSVVGAGLAYGQEALKLATTVKLARALWIVPLTFCAAALLRKGNAPRRHPWFILGFIAAAAACTWIPGLHGFGHALSLAARKGMALALFGIGAGISLTSLRRVGPRPLLMGLLLWIIVASISLTCIRMGLA